MEEKEEFENSLKLTKISFLFSGILIFRVKNVNYKMFINALFFFNFVWLYTDVFGEFYWLIEGIQGGKSFSELTMIAPCATICLLSTAKSGPLYFNRHTLLKITEKLREMHPITPKNEENINLDDVEDLQDSYEMDAKTSERIERKIVKDSMTFLNAVILLLFYSSTVVTTVFSFTPVVSMAYDYYTEGQIELKFPFLIKYFFDPFSKARWPFVYIHQVWSTVIAAFEVFSADTFLYVFCSCIQMHFRILCHRLQYVVCESSSKTRERLVTLIERHQELIELVNQMEAMYAKSTLFNIITSSVLICLSAFNVTFLDDAGAVFAFLTFLFMSLSQISLLCFFGDMLLRSSKEVSEAVYKCRWYDTDRRTKRSMLFILMRAQKPCKLTAANFADVNLTAFTTILSRSWSYFALLKTMYK